MRHPQAEHSREPRWEQVRIRTFSLCLAALTIIGLMLRGIPSSAAPGERSLAAEPVEVLTGDNNYFLKVNLRDARVRPRVMLANNDSGGLQSLAGIKTRLENQGYASWAIVNGDLFSSNCPGGVNCAQGLTYIDGQRKYNWSEYGLTWTGRGNLGLDSSNNVQIAVGSGQTRTYMTIGGGPRIVMGGGAPTCQAEYNTPSSIAYCGWNKTFFPASGECFDGNVSYWCTDTRAITLLGYSADGQYLYMGISREGKTVTQLAQWLKDRGAHEVLRLDSGSSSGMYHNGTFIGGSNGKAIANAFAVTVESGPSPPTPTPQPPSGDWHVEYFPNTNLNDLCATGSHSGTFVFRDWQEDKPSGNCPPDNWSARFRRRVHFQTGSYTFALGSDDWARILVEYPPNQVVVNNWQGAGQHYESRYLNEGDYWVTVEFADTLGHAKLAAWWWGPGFSMPRESRDPNQWYAEYWGNKDLWWDSIIRVNEGTTLDHEWYGEGPGYTLPDDRFSSRFERRVHFSCGRYRFNSYADDGVRFKIAEVNGGNWLINEWHDGRATYPSDPVDLAEGDYTLILEHYENGGWARVSLSWEFLQGCHTVSTPSTPSGPSSGETGQTLNYTTGGSTDSLGHSVQYRFDWGDGSYSTWSSSVSASHSWSSAATYCVKAQARCSVDTSVTSSWSGCKNVTISAPHTVSTPSTPSGPSSGETGQALNYTTGGSTGSQGHSVQYRFDWGDGTYSTWSSSTSGSHSWSSAATYCVKAQARCSVDTSVTSSWSGCKNVTISSSQTGICIPARSLSCGSSHSWNNGGAGSTDEIDSYSCSSWNESGPEYAYSFLAIGAGEVDVTLSGMSADLDIFVIEESNGLCNRLRCISHGDNSASFGAEAGQTYYLVVDGYYGDVSDYTITVNCSIDYPPALFLPVVMKNFTPGVEGGIHGRATENGSAAAAVSLDLRYYNGSSWSTKASTTTGADGRYLFAGVPSLGSGQRYYVRYWNTSGTPGRLSGWATWSISSYIAGTNLHAGDFDIADIALVSPPNGATVSLPRIFSWTPRFATPSDDYEFDLFDGEWWWTDPTLGYAGEYTLNSLPTGFYSGTEYWWEVCAYGPYGYGWSYEARAVTFSDTGAAAAASALPARRVPPEEMEDFVRRR